jgi:hypothetical protein
MTGMIKKIEPTNDVCIKFSEEEMEKLKLLPGTKLSIEEFEDGAIRLVPFATLEVDISEWSREVLEMLIAQSCTQDVSVNEIIQKILNNYIDSE